MSAASWPSESDARMRAVKYGPHAKNEIITYGATPKSKCCFIALCRSLVYDLQVRYRKAMQCLSKPSLRITAGLGAETSNPRSPQVPKRNWRPRLEGTALRATSCRPSTGQETQIRSGIVRKMGRSDPSFKCGTRRSVLRPSGNSKQEGRTVRPSCYIILHVYLIFAFDFVFWLHVRLRSLGVLDNFSYRFD